MRCSSWFHVLAHSVSLFCMCYTVFPVTCFISLPCDSVLYVLSRIRCLLFFIAVMCFCIVTAFSRFSPLLTHRPLIYCVLCLLVRRQTQCSFFCPCALLHVAHFFITYNGSQWTLTLDTGCDAMVKGGVRRNVRLQNMKHGMCRTKQFLWSSVIKLVSFQCYVNTNDSRVIPADARVA